MRTQWVLLVGALVAIVAGGAWVLARARGDSAADPPSPEGGGGVPTLSASGVPAEAGSATRERGSRVTPAGGEGTADARATEGGRALIVRVATDDDGHPVAGVTVAAIPPEGGGAEVVGVTDPTGTARLALPWAKGGSVVVRRGGGGEVASLPIDGSVAGGANDLRLLVPRRRVLLVSVRKGGEPFLPKGIRFRVGDLPLSVLQVIEAEAVVQIAFQPGPETTCPLLALEADGVRPVSVPMPPESGNVGDDVIVDLEPAGPALDVEVSGDPDLTQLVLLQRRADALAPWTFDRAVRPRPTREDPRRSLARVEGLPAGTYRVCGGPIRTFTDEVRVRAGAERAVALALDLSRAGWASGTIAVPPGLDPNLAEVWMWEGSPSEPSASFRAGSGTTFRIAVPGDRSVTLQVHHPQALPHSIEGTVQLVEPRDGIVLRLERGPMADVRLLAPDGSDLPHGALVAMWILHGDPSSRIQEHQWCRVEGTSCRFGGWAAGPCSIVLDDGLHVPLLLERVDLTASETHLGIQRLAEGRSIHVRAVIAPDQEVPAFAVGVERLDGPYPIQRWGSEDSGSTRPPSKGVPILHIRGLPPGRYRVSVHGPSGPLPPAKGLTQTVDLGPDADVDAIVDFRPGALDAVSPGAR